MSIQTGAGLSVLVLPDVKPRAIASFKGLNPSGFHPFRSPLAACRRTHACFVCISVLLSIQMLDSANSVTSCSVFLACRTDQTTAAGSRCAAS